MTNYTVNTMAIEYYMIKRGITYKRLASVLNVGVSYIHGITCGRVQPTPLEVLEIANLLGMTHVQMFKDK